MSSYIGRFAPSPTGPLHLGSLYAALASYLDARASRGRWLVRMEDIDPPREIAGAADTILRQLENHGLHWDDVVLYQSQRLEAYRDALDHLRQKGLVFPCRCPRARLRSLGGVYDGRCREARLPGKQTLTDAAIRLICPEQIVNWRDLIRGPCQTNLGTEVGDFIVVRRDGLVAYQLAVSVDDAYQNITHVIRGDDLLDSTPRQIHILQLLGHKAPDYGHIPVIQDSRGYKLSKQSFAPAIDSTAPAANLYQCLTLLGLAPPLELSNASCEFLLQWAIPRWQRTQLPSAPGKVDSPKAG